MQWAWLNYDFNSPNGTKLNSGFEDFSEELNHISVCKKVSSTLYVEIKSSNSENALGCSHFWLVLQNVLKNCEMLKQTWTSTKTLLQIWRILFPDPSRQNFDLFATIGWSRIMAISVPMNAMIICLQLLLTQMLRFQLLVLLINSSDNRDMLVFRAEFSMKMHFLYNHVTKLEVKSHIFTFH